MRVALDPITATGGATEATLTQACHLFCGGIFSLPPISCCRDADGVSVFRNEGWRDRGVKTIDSVGLLFQKRYVIAVPRSDVGLIVRPGPGELPGCSRPPTNTQQQTDSLACPNYSDLGA